MVTLTFGANSSGEAGGESSKGAGFRRPSLTYQDARTVSPALMPVKLTLEGP